MITYSFKISVFAYKTTQCHKPENHNMNWNFSVWNEICEFIIQKDMAIKKCIIYGNFSTALHYVPSASEFNTWSQ
jgi:hypothetical protein